MAKYTYVTETISPEKREKWRRRHWREDRVADLPQGFTYKSSGRQGSIYYREGEQILEIPWEMSGAREVDILVHLSGLDHWVLPQTELVPAADVVRIEEALKAWMKFMNYRADLVRDPLPSP